MSNGDVTIPPTDLTTAAIQAVDLILSQFGLSPLDVILGLFSGKPKFDDTLAVIAAYNQSAYWPLHALAADMQIWVKNGAPISDSNPAVQATFGAAKQGTVTSIQQLAGEQPGPNSPGYWTIFALIQKSWELSGYGEQSVLQAVKALDALTQVLSQLNKPAPTPPPPTPVPPPQPTPAPTLVPCDSGDFNQDEILDLCHAVNSSLRAILAALSKLPQGTPGGGQNDCCTAVVTALMALAQQLTTIAAALTFPRTTPVTLDFSPLVDALGGLVTAVGAYDPLLQAIANALTGGLPEIAKAISTAPGTDLSGVVKALTTLATQGDVDQAIFQALQQQGTLSAADLQTLQGIKWSDALSYIMSSAPWRTFQKIGKVVEADYDAISQSVINFNAKVDHWAAQEVLKGLTTERNLIQNAITPILNAAKSALQPSGIKQIGQIGVNPDTVLADVAAVGLNIEAIATLISLAREGAGERISKIGDYATGLLGFEELREVQLGPLVEFGIARIAEMQAKKLFSQELPGAGALAGLQARALITGAQYETWVPYTGLPGELWEQTRQAAYSGLGARRILPLVQTGLFSPADIQDELTFSGLRPASMKRYLLAAPYLATNTERNTLRSSIEKAYIAGLLSDADLENQVNSAEQNTDRNSLILTRARLEKLIAATKDLEAEYTTMYIGNLIDDATYRANLSGIGLQPDMVNFLAGKAEARAHATLLRKQEAAALALQKATTSVERQTALKNFEEGNTPVALYTATLIGTGMTPVQAAAWTDLALLKKAGNVRWIYGLQLTPVEATVLKQRESALTDQRKRLLISQQQYVDGLTQLGISPTWINALDAAVEALITPKASAFLVPVQT